MKKMLLFVFSLVFTTHVASADNDIYTTDVNKLPEVSRQFLSTHFPDIKVAHISIEKNLFGVKDYDVILTDGTEVEFFKTGEWKEVIRTNLAVPEKLVPAAIADYVQVNFPKMFIVSIEKDGKKKEIKLNNGVELDFNSAGRLLKIDY